MSEMKSFQDAFYMIAKELGLDHAQPLSPREVFEGQMLPRIKQLVAAHTVDDEPVAWMTKPLRGSNAGKLCICDPAEPRNPELWQKPFPVFAAAHCDGAVCDVLTERQRQVEQEGWTPEHDDEHDGSEMAEAASCYALSAAGHVDHTALLHWPWHHTFPSPRGGPDRKAPAWWKPTTPRRNLVKAAALIIAEIQRLDREKMRTQPDRGSKPC